MISSSSDNRGARERRRGGGRRWRIAIAAIGVLLVVAAVAGTLAAVREYQYATSIVRYTTGRGEVKVETGTIEGLGPVLVTNRGYALYMFPPDRARHVTCTGDCASAWPPLLLPPGGRVAAGRGVRSDLLSTVPNPGGGRVVTYDGWPLYVYVGDGGPLRAEGQAVDADGGYWYVMHPSGEIVKSRGGFRQ